MRRFVVVTPVLNGADFIEKTLGSVDAQTHPHWVHYVVDGGSTDATLEIVRRSTAAEPRRRLVTGPDLGLYDGLLKGFEHAKEDGSSPQDICLWINSDDMLMPWAFSTVARSMEATRAEWVTALPTQWDAEGRLMLVQTFVWYPRWWIRRGWLNGRGLGWIQQESTFFARGLLERVPSDRLARVRMSRLAGDFLLWQSFAELAPLVTIPTAIAGFRSHGGNASTLMDERYFKEVREAGGVVLPTMLGRSVRLIYQWVALFVTWKRFRTAARLRMWQARNQQ